MFRLDCAAVVIMSAQYAAQRLIHVSLQKFHALTRVFPDIDSVIDDRRQRADEGAQTRRVQAVQQRCQIPVMEGTFPANFSRGRKTCSFLMPSRIVSIMKRVTRVCQSMLFSSRALCFGTAFLMKCFHQETVSNGNRPLLFVVVNLCPMMYNAIGYANIYPAGELIEWL